ncbi:HAD-superfamily hydrolase [Rhodopseudomonas palustris HaA2]|uniref:phosphoglycolate phosphatase n=1 Tax=Rhodopseudomonas palustris (strain HaA2) TaxID=316058 RepID=Q2IYD9_RHOP2|nr:HAD-IA family hydrolase [Rhodopseudomonas palustris]ABD06771.1 HAD-superfamily hydrolase [Rhodopseudomonas palustris HaA2]
MTAVLFDLDGVLIDSWQAVEAAFLAAAADHALDGRARLSDFRARMGMPLEAIVAEFGFPSGFPAAFRAAARLHDPKARAFPGVVAMLQHIRSAGLKLGVVTGKDRPRTLSILAATGLIELVDAVVTADDAPGKPAPDGLWLCERRLGAGAALAFVGDTAIDLAAARNAGRIAMLAHWGGGPQVTDRAGVIEVATPGEVTDLVVALAQEARRLEPAR